MLQLLMAFAMLMLCCTSSSFCPSRYRTEAVHNDLKYLTKKRHISDNLRWSFFYAALSRSLPHSCSFEILSSEREECVRRE